MGNHLCGSTNKIISPSTSQYIVWLEDNNEAKENLLTRFSLIHTNLVHFDDSDKCEAFITEHENKDLVLIVSNKWGHEIVGQVEDLPQIKVIFVYLPLNESKASLKWIYEYQKVTHSL